MHTLSKALMLSCLTVMSLAGCKARQDGASETASARDTNSISCNGTGMCVVTCTPGKAHRGTDGMLRCVDRDVPADVVDTGKICNDELPAQFSKEDGCKALNPQVAGGGGPLSGGAGAGSGQGGGGTTGGTPSSTVPDCFKNYPEFGGIQDRKSTRLNSSH